ncbi:MAG: OmpA family protein [Bacteroidales bacterium]|nr:OmpA family protein [Bacteroidales bacterium]
MKKIIFTLTIFLSIWQVQGQTDIFNWKLSAGASTFRFDNAFGFPEDFKSTAANLHLERSLNRSFSAGISLFAGKPAGGDLKKAGFAALTLGFRWDNGWLLGERVFLAPFHTIEAGYLAGETRTDASDSHEFAAGMTHGLKFRLSDRFSARIATGLYYPINDSQGSKLSELNFYQQWQLGLSYHFGARKISYRGPVFNAGDFFPVLPGSEAKDQLIPFDELEGIPQPIIRPRVVEEEKVILRRAATQSEENRIDISLSDTLIQIRVSEGEAVTINIAHQMLRDKRITETEKRVVIDTKEAEEVTEEEAEEESETVAPESPSEPAESVKTETIEKEVEVVRGEVFTETKQAAPLETEIITEEVSEKETETISQTEAKAVTTETQIKPKEPEEVVEEEEEIEEIEETKEIETAEEVQPEIQQTETVTEEVFSETKVEKPLEVAKEKQEKTSTVKTPVSMAKQEPVEEEAVKEPVEPVVTATETPSIVSDVVLVQVPDSLMARYPVILTFPFNSAALQESHQETLEQVAADLEAYPLLLSKISGYTDKSGDPIYNMILSGRRAEAVLNFLMDCGIDPVRLSAEALGDQFSSEEFSEEERRVEIHLISTPEPDEEP